MIALRRIPAGEINPEGVVGAARRAVVLSADDRVLLRQLRDLARRAQLSGPIAVHHACSLRAPAGARQYGLALMRTLDAVATRPLQFHPASADEVAFDELWLIRLLRCLQSGDTGSARLLIETRTRRLGRRAVAYLAQGLASGLLDNDFIGRDQEAK